MLPTSTVLAPRVLLDFKLESIGYAASGGEYFKEEFCVGGKRKLKERADYFNYFSVSRGCKPEEVGGVTARGLSGHSDELAMRLVSWPSRPTS